MKVKTNKKICLIIKEQNKLSSYKGTQSYWNHSDCNTSIEHQWAAASFLNKLKTGWIIYEFLRYQSYRSYDKILEINFVTS